MIIKLIDIMIYIIAFQQLAPLFNKKRTGLPRYELKFLCSVLRGKDIYLEEYATYKGPDQFKQSDVFKELKEFNLSRPWLCPGWKGWAP